MTEHWEKQDEEYEPHDDDLICMNVRACEHPYCPEHCGDQSGWALPPENWSTVIRVSEMAAKGARSEHSEELVGNTLPRFPEVSANRFEPRRGVMGEIDKDSESLSSPPALC